MKMAEWMGRYTQNLTFAKEHVYPLLEGLNAWWGCFLVKLPTAGGGYVYADTSTADIVGQ